MKYCVFILSLFCLVSCSSYQSSAPVRDVNTHRVGHVLYYHVQPGETLYSVAWRFDRDYRHLAALNGLSAPYAIYPGENLRLSGPAKKVKRSVAIAKQQRTANKRSAVPVEREPSGKVKRWYWPAKGKISKHFSQLNKGIDIAGYDGASVLAAATGKVVYAGNGIRGYGNLIILKHNATYLSAYAYNKQIFVHEGQWVKVGQRIATMGKTESGRVALHFEIRRAGKPVNPLKYLSSLS